MKRLWWRLMGRFYLKRARRAERLARVFQTKSEKFFRKIKGAR